MTEKRFTEIISTGVVRDNLTGKEYLCEMRIDDELLDLLNKQHETIQRLKQNIDELMQIDVEEDLLKENEWLKKHILEVEKDNERLEQITSQFKVGDIVNLKIANEIIDEQRKKIRILNDEKEQLKQYKQAVSDVLLSYSQKNVSAKQLGLLSAIMHELGVLE